MHRIVPSGVNLWRQLCPAKDAPLDDDDDECNRCIETLNRWFIANRLHMNADKTNIMVFPETKANEICVKLSDTAIKKVQHCRYPVSYTHLTLPTKRIV